MGFKLSRYARIVSQQLIQCPLQGLPICVISLGCSPFLPDWLLCLCGFLTKQNGRTDAGLILIVQ